MLAEFGIVLGKIAFVLFLILNGAGILTWVERKQGALISDRIGANRASILGIKLWGLINSLADAMKLAFKEDYSPPRGLHFLHSIAPAIAMFPVFLTFAVIPFGPPIELWGHHIRLQILNLDIGVLFILAFGSIAVYGSMIAGWASNSKYALLGGMRTSAQMISYEIILGLALIGPILVFGTMEPAAMVNAQNTLLWGWLPRWGIVVQPLAFLLFLPAALAEGKRAPFDMPEGESEIIGYFTEYSGMRWGMFFLGELAEIVVLSAVITTIFLGGYHIPYLYDAVEQAGQAGFHFPWGSYWALGDWTVAILRIIAFALKVAFLMWFQIQVRWTFPRFRYDQLMRVSWREMMPAALLNIGITGLILMLLKN
ncbi:NADH-quinone oxidoreductase subunit H [bacterium]|nr:NADH-quinone oxidoreductase subunit H [bacterium]MBU1636929.1 NADH-quinone oxidoreductase subunit H [bacterium]MBU1921294.1 NADH-quinone oxidoreductase subunit H [bacterium]